MSFGPAGRPTAEYPFAAAPRSTLEDRAVTIGPTYDPDNLFRRNQNVPPRA